MTLGEFDQTALTPHLRRGEASRKGGVCEDAPLGVVSLRGWPRRYRDEVGASPGPSV